MVSSSTVDLAPDLQITIPHTTHTTFDAANSGVGFTYCVGLSPTNRARSLDLARAHLPLVEIVDRVFVDGSREELDLFFKHFPTGWMA